MGTGAAYGLATYRRLQPHQVNSVSKGLYHVEEF
jgi:hypothetical protein